MNDFAQTNVDWVYPLKRKILFGIISIFVLILVVAMFFIAFALRKNLISDGTVKTRELSNTINFSLKALMLARNPDMIQHTVENIGKSNSSLVRAFILNKDGRIVYSSDKGEIGKVLDRYQEKSCHGCHQQQGVAPSDRSIFIDGSGGGVHRNVKVIYNEDACYGCHARTDRINGKLIIDRSMKKTYATIAEVEAIIFGSGIVCIIILVPFTSRVLSKGVNRYIAKIAGQHAELRLLYVMIERLSKTIDLEELKEVVIRIIRESLEADEVDMVLHKSYRDYRVTGWTRQSDRISRKKIEKDSPIYAVIERWINRGIPQEEVSEDKRLIHLPIRKGESDLALLIIRKAAGAFDPVRTGLLPVMASHISVAFENALLYHIAITDELTGLYTQRYFRTSIGRKLAEHHKYGERFTLLMLDIDDFKQVNDTFGHMVGDSVLKNTAGCMTASIRDNDLAFRYGGEEFAVILPSTDAAGARHVAERIRETIGRHVFEDGAVKLHITISIGSSTCPDNAPTVRDLMVTADQALYRAKQEGKNRVVLSDFRQERT